MDFSHPYQHSRENQVNRSLNDVILLRRERISLDRDHGRERCGDFHSVASTTTTNKSVRFSMEQMQEEEAAAAAAEIYMDYRKVSQKCDCLGKFSSLNSALK